MQQHSLKSPQGSKKNRKRVGRGDSSGSGSYSGKGMKGQKSRSGGGVRPGFEGGQLPLIKKLSALRGFNNIFRREFIPINLNTISKLYEKDNEISPETLVEKNVLKDTKSPIKILGDGEINFSGLTTGQKMTKEIETLPTYYRTKIECEKNLKRLKGNKNLKLIDSFNGEKSVIITDNKPLVNKKRIVVNAFQCLEIAY